MTSLLLRGTYTAAAWQRILREPDSAHEQLSSAAAAVGGRLFDQWFAFDDTQFYAVVDDVDSVEGALVRHRLWAGGDFESLGGDALFSPAQIVAAIPRDGAS